MPNQQIIDYLNQNKDQYPLEELKEQLLIAGYSKAEIKEAIKIVFSSEKISTQSPPPATDSQTDSSQFSSSVSKSLTPLKKSLSLFLNYSRMFFWAALGYFLSLVIIAPIALWFFRQQFYWKLVLLPGFWLIFVLPSFLLAFTIAWLFSKVNPAVLPNQLAFIVPILYALFFQFTALFFKSKSILIFGYAFKAWLITPPLLALLLFIFNLVNLFLIKKNYRLDKKIVLIAGLLVVFLPLVTLDYFASYENYGKPSQALKTEPLLEELKATKKWEIPTEFAFPTLDKENVRMIDENRVLLFDRRAILLLESDSGRVLQKIETPPNTSGFLNEEGSFVIDQDRLFCLDDRLKNELFCFDLNSGKILWAFNPLGAAKKIANFESTFESYIQITFLKKQDNLIFLIAVTDKNDFLFCLDAQDGQMVWGKEVGQFLVREIYIYEKNLYLLSSDYLLCLDTKTGAELWRQKGLSGDEFWAFGDFLVFINKEKKVSESFKALDLRTRRMWEGKEKIRRGQESIINSIKVVRLEEGILYLGIDYSYQTSDYCRVYAFRFQDGEKLWETELEGSIENFDSSSDSILVQIVHPKIREKIGERRILCFNKSSGQTLWEVQDNLVLQGVFEGKIYAFGVDFLSEPYGPAEIFASLYVLDSKTGNKIGILKPEEVNAFINLVFSKDKVYLLLHNSQNLLSLWELEDLKDK